MQIATEKLKCILYAWIRPKTLWKVQCRWSLHGKFWFIVQNIWRQNSWMRIEFHCWTDAKKNIITLFICQKRCYSQVVPHSSSQEAAHQLFLFAFNRIWILFKSVIKVQKTTNEESEHRKQAETQSLETSLLKKKLSESEKRIKKPDS